MSEREREREREGNWVNGVESERREKRIRLTKRQAGVHSHWGDDEGGGCHEERSQHILHAVCRGAGSRGI